jgi:hypothetical protein
MERIRQYQMLLQIRAERDKIVPLWDAPSTEPVQLMAGVTKLVESDNRMVPKRAKRDKKKKTGADEKNLAGDQVVVLYLDY